MESAVADARAAASAAGFRALAPEEIRALEAAGNRNEDPTWANIRVSDAWDASRVVGCFFGGQVRIGRLQSSSVRAARGLPAGLYHSSLRDCVVGDDARVSNCELVDKTHIGPRTSLARCGVITKAGPGAFGNGTELPVVIGSGGREVIAYANLDLNEAAEVAANRHDAALLKRHRASAAAFVDAVRCDMNIFCEDARIESAELVEDVFLGPHACVEGSHLEHVTMLSSKEEPTVIRGGSDVRNAVLQENVHVDSQSIVLNAMMLTCSHAERHGKLLDSILGPYSGVAEGEISESLVGPFVGFHHQSLLIASFWPAGRGNVGYGANVGSNHTGKAPDQELWHGEGCFYGLGCCIKFPSDFSHAPYSLVATGVTTLPQRVTFPFSLISAPMTPAAGISPAFNEIQPGWVLSQNIYMVLRNEHKFAARGGKSRSIEVDARILRPGIVAMMRLARDQLADPAVPDKKVYTDRDFAGLGKNIMTHAARLEAVHTYTYFLVYYALLHGLWPRLGPNATAEQALAAAQDIERASSVAAAEPAAQVTFTGARRRGAAPPVAADAEWAYQCAILRHEAVHIVFKDQLRGPAPAGLALVRPMLEWLVGAKKAVAESAKLSKIKDEKRGAKLIPGYVDAHGRVAEADSLVRRAADEAAHLGNEVSNLLRLLAGSRL